MKFFKLSKDEISAVRSFQQSCIKDQLEVILTKPMTECLLMVYKSDGVDLRDMGRCGQPLLRRGFVRENTDGKYIITELGMLALGMAEAGGLLPTPSNVTKINTHRKRA